MPSFYFPVVKKIFKESSDHSRKYGLKAEFIWSYKRARRTKRLLVTSQTFGYWGIPIDESCYIALCEWDI